jgi:hypothetical protein
MISYSQISEELARYLNGKTDLDSFEDWIVVNTWNIHLARDPKAEKLAFAIEESLAEYSSGHLSESELKEEFRALLIKPMPASFLEFAVSFAGDKYSPRGAKSSMDGSLIIVQEPDFKMAKNFEQAHLVLV